MPFAAPPFASRRRAPTSGPDIEADLLACALCRTGSLPNLDQHFEPALLELADRHYRGLSLWLPESMAAAFRKFWPHALRMGKSV